MIHRHEFYKRTVQEIIPDRQSSILVCGAGRTDKEIFEKAGYLNVTISNLDDRMTGNEYAPYEWKYENAEKLSFPDASFDYTVIHAAIHHASSPHRVLTEMYRVSRRGVLAFEARDSTLMRLLERLGVALSFEHAAVHYNGGKFGGVNNTEVPNYIYRWTEREVEKTTYSFAPYARHRFRYFYETAIPAMAEVGKYQRAKRLALSLLSPMVWAFTRLFPRQQNLFAFFVEKPSLEKHLFPWLKHVQGKICFNREWAAARYQGKAPT